MTHPLKSCAALLLSALLLWLAPLAVAAQGGKTGNPPPSTTSNADSKPLFFKAPPNSRASISENMTTADFPGELPRADLLLKSRRTDPSGMEHVKFRQTHQSLKVEGAEFAAHLLGGQTQTISGNIAGDLESYTPQIAITESQALNAALQFVAAQKYAWESPRHELLLRQLTGNGSSTFRPEGEMVILSPQLIPTINEAMTAYRFDIYAVQPLEKVRVYVNALDGSVATHYELLHQADVSATGQSNYYGTCHFTADSTEASSYYLRESGRGGGIITYNAAFDTSYVENHFASSNNAWDADPTAIDVHWGTEKTYDYFWEMHNRNSFDGQGSPLLSWVHFNLTNYGFSSNNNAFWNGLWMTYGDGDGIDYGPYTAINIVAHEITHGVIEHSADLMYWYESGALSESFSDIFGEAVEQYATNGTDWLVASEVTHNDAGLRSFANPNEHGQPDTYMGDNWYAGANDFGGVHINGGVQNHWFYLLSVGGAGTNDHGYAYDLTGIGMEKAAQIAYRNLTQYLGPTSQYANARAGAIQAATDLFGEGSEEALQTAEAWCAVGVGNCSQNGEQLQLATPSSGTSYTAGNSQTISWMSAGDIPLVNIDYSISGGANWIPLVHNLPNTNSYLWNIPNISTNLARIRISASHNPTIFDTGQGNFTINACGIQASFTSPANGICQGSSYNFQNTSLGEPSAQTWTVNGQEVSTAINHTHLFNNPGVFEIGLTVTKGACSHNHRVVLQVYPQPDASFTMQPDLSNPESGLVIFNPASIDASNSYYWDFGDGTSSTLAQPQRAYASGGYYNVCLTVQNACSLQTNCLEQVILPEKFSFQYAYPNLLNEGGARFAPSQTGGYIMAAHVYDSLDTSGVGIAKADGGGRPLWAKMIADGHTRHVSDILEHADGSLFIAGKVYDNSTSNSVAFLMKTDETGQFLWERHYGTQEGDEAIELATLPDGSLMMLANTGLYGLGGNDIAVLKLDQSGNPIWTSKLGSPGTDKAAGFCTLPDGAAVIAGSIQSSYGDDNIMVVKTDPDGSLAWVKSLGSTFAESGVAVAYDPDDGGFYVAGTLQGYTAPQYKSLLLKLDSLGNKLWAKSYEQGGMEISAYAMKRLQDGKIAMLANAKEGNAANIHLIVCDGEGNSLSTGVYGSGFQYAADLCASDHQSALTFLGISRSMEVNLFSSFSIDSINTGAPLFLVHEPIGQDGAPNGSCGVNLMQTISANYAAISPMGIASFAAAAVQPPLASLSGLPATELPFAAAANLCCSLPDADFEVVSTVGRTLGFQPLLTDTATSYVWHFGEPDSLGYPAVAKTYKGEPTLVEHTYSSSGTFHLCLTASNDCGSRSHCKDISVAGVHTFQKTYPAITDIRQSGILALPNGTFACLGQSSASTYKTILLTNLDEGGNPLWAQSYPTEIGQERATGILQDKDGGFLIIALRLDNNHPVLLKTDSLGNLLWRKSLGISTLDGFIAQSSDGGYLVASYSSGLQCAKLDSAYNVAWSFEYETGQFAAVLDIAPSTDGGCLLAGIAQNDLPGFGNALLMKIDANGELAWSRVFSNELNNISNIVSLGNGSYAICGSTGGGLHACIVDENGMPLQARSYSTTQQMRGSSIMPDVDGGFLISGAVRDSLEASAWNTFRIKTDAAGNVAYSLSQNLTQRDNTIKVFPQQHGGNVVFADIKNDLLLSNILAMARTDGSGSTICNEQPLVFQSDTLNLATANYGGFVKQSLDTPETSLASNQQQVSIAYELACDENHCIEIGLAADRRYICTGDSINFSNQLGQPAGFTFTWLVDGMPISNANNLTYVFSQGGYHHIVLAADNGAGCHSSQSLTVYADDDCVWPGDFNRNGKVNHHDVLAFGLAYGESGVVRPNASSGWFPQAAEPWEGSINGINHKHVDADGNGMIDLLDYGIIDGNYGNMQTASIGNAAAPSFTESIVQIRPLIVEVPQVSNNNTLSIDIILESGIENGTPTEISAYGMAFTIDYSLSGLTLSNPQVNYDNSWLGIKDVDLVTVHHNIAGEQKMEIGLSRIDHKNQSGFGRIAQFIVEVDDDDLPTLDTLGTLIQIYDIKLITNEGEYIPVSSYSYDIAPTSLQMQLKAMLEGSATYAASGNSLMHNTLWEEGLIPLQQPFNVAPYYYEGTESIPDYGSMPEKAVDWVLVELYSPEDLMNPVARKAAIMLANGSIMEYGAASQYPLLRFYGIDATANYHLALRHRNHVDVMTPFTLSPDYTGNLYFDFTNTHIDPALNKQLTKLPSGLHALKAGDVNGDGVISLLDSNYYKLKKGQYSQYLPEDVNMDEMVDEADFQLILKNSGTIGNTYIRY